MTEHVTSWAYRYVLGDTIGLRTPYTVTFFDIAGVGNGIITLQDAIFPQVRYTTLVTPWWTKKAGEGGVYLPTKAIFHQVNERLWRIRISENEAEIAGELYPVPTGEKQMFSACAKALL
jgi:hypothetical protein